MEAVVERVEQESDLSAVVRSLGLAPEGCIALVGGADGMTADELRRAERIVGEGLVPLAQRRGAAIADGGTDTGVMQIVGRTRAAAAASFPLVGVAVGALVRTSGDDGGAALEPNHSHFVLVPGSDWGDEAPWLSRVVSALAPGDASATVLVNGGDIAWLDVEESVRAGRPLVVVDGSGRTADELAAALRGEDGNPRGTTLAASGLVHVAAIDDPAAFARTVDRLLAAS